MILLNKLYKLTVLVLGLVLLQGCATVGTPAFDETTTALDTSEKSVVIMQVDFYNQYKPGAQADGLVVAFEKPRTGDKPERLMFNAGPLEVIADTGHSVGTIRGALAPGKYKLKAIFGNSFRGISPGRFMIPIEQSIEIPDNSVVYLGTVNAVNRKRVDSEFRSGSMIPFLDQAVNGYSGGTLDVETLDDLESAEAKLKQKFPVLESVTITKLVLEPFDRSKWDKK